ncbi:hypothetical protein LTR05_002724 [Lithohypha guttulata]|uniref:Zn(2)-C6 fungal-type domain-containing protein n=1 Tax=Lithohypha guttulata TaxID=1690604 RepID=A0AAN7T5H1_9EURO|nr:hypothetical protein LTR05_002724 [Lithohypha guttulata]
MQSFQPANVLAQGPKNYVFVDEHNRHKRLKVMRACEGCRRRKIKCDAATTNSWPCAACKRLKLTCVPPTGGVDGDLSVVDSDIDQFGATPASIPPQQYPGDQIQYLHNYGSQSDLGQSYSPYGVQGNQHLYNQHQFDYSSTRHASSQAEDAPLPAHQQQRLSSFDSANGHAEPHSFGSPQSSDSVTAEDLAENLGDLRIADSGVAPYIRQQNGSLQEAPAPIVEDDEDLPAFSTAAGSQIRIPPALMPTNEEASKAFQEFFRHVHPYAPVLCRNHFLRQWQQDRGSISPLLLEAVFACAGQVSDDPAGGSQWLALANRHEENFADTPRLSTIQALLLLLKAREKTPKRGYYYRSWITVRKIVGMAKDLDLHEHFDMHNSGGTCDSGPVDCLSKTRIWQVTMLVELMVGAPQGRTDYGVDVDTVNVSPSPPNADIDEYERAISRQCGYWMRNVRNIKGVTHAYYELKRKNKDWATDPKFVAYNEDFTKWPNEVPQDLTITIPPDGSLPKLPSHFLANMHCHYQLGIVMLYKPQLSASKDFANDEKWKHFMFACYTAAKRVCILQEAILQQFDILGLSSMQRGLSFPIYAILTCVMVHLVAIVSPDPVLNRDSKEYFVRHMRVLERCIQDWPMPEVESQINGLRTAFSADLRKPFDLKPSFPYGTPSEQGRSPGEHRPSEPLHLNHHNHGHTYLQPQTQHGSHFVTPPASTRSLSRPHDQTFYHGYNDHVNQNYHQFPATTTSNNGGMAAEPWNPTPIINQFNAAFAIPESALAPPPPPPSNYTSSSPVTLAHQNFGQHVQAHTHLPSPISASGYNSRHPYTPSPTSQPMAHPQSYIQTTPQPQLTPSHYPQQQTGNPYFDSSMNNHHRRQSTHVQQQMQGSHRPYSSIKGEPVVPNEPVYVTPREWQQSVASVFDPGLKRKYEYEQQGAMQ